VKYLLVMALAAASMSAAQDTRTFTGVISDDMCAHSGHEQMRMGPTDAECTRACVMLHGALFVLTDGKSVYILDDQQAPDTYAGQKVTVTGTLDAKSNTIHVSSIAAAK
jgi:hypothetical protein